MNFPLFIAGRYLFAKKSHNVINIISLISAAGITIGTMALIIILSVFNGFNGFISDQYNAYESDLLIERSDGGFFLSAEDAFSRIRENESVLFCYEIVESNVFVNYNNSEGVAVIRGVDSLYEQNSFLRSNITEGDLQLHFGELPHALVGQKVAYEFGVRPNLLRHLDLFFPIKGVEISLMNPLASLNKISIFPSGIVRLDQNYDKSYIYIPIESARELLQLEDNQVNKIEIVLKGGVNNDKVRKEFASLLGGDYRVKDRYEQNEMIYKMIKYENVMIYMIMFFIILIISFNVFGSLSMLIMEKNDDIRILKSMGADDGVIKRIFSLEGWLIVVIGAVTGLLLGLGLAYIQQRFGLLKMPGNFAIDAYPVVIKGRDVLFTFLGISLIGYIIAILPKGKGESL